MAIHENMGSSQQLLTCVSSVQDNLDVRLSRCWQGMSINAFTSLSAYDSNISMLKLKSACG